MDPQIVAALLGVIGVVAGAAVTAYRAEIKNFFSRTNEHNYLKGKWDASWQITSSAGPPPREISDQVSIQSVNGKLIKGSGSTRGFGDWTLEGKASEFAITLSFHGDGDKSDLVGVVILKKVTPIKLDGVWCQYTADGSLKSGTTTWDKVRYKAA